MPHENLVEVLRQFEEADAALDRWIAEDRDHRDPHFVELHRSWETACSRAAALDATCASGLAVKARILIAVLKVVAPPEAERRPLEALADSLARNLLALGRAEKLH